jgi:two-component system, sensor histidine kinase
MSSEIRLPMIDSPVATSSARRTLVLVDDDEAFRYAIGRTLSRCGWSVEVASGGVDAVELCRIYRPPLVLIDLRMPGIDGYDTCRRIRAERWGHNMVLAAVSGMLREHAEPRALRAGFDFFLGKPLDPQRLQSILSSPDFSG